MLITRRRAMMAASALVASLFAAYWLAPLLLVRAAVSWTQAKTGRALDVERARLHWGRALTVDLAGISLANASWSRTPSQLTIGRLRASLPLLSLLPGRDPAAVIHVEGVHVLLERDGAKTNWTFGSRPAAHPFMEWRGDARALVRHAFVSDLRVRYHDPAAESDITGHLRELRVERSGRSMRIRGAGMLDGKSLDFVSELEDDGRLRLSARLGSTRLEVRGPDSGALSARIRGEDLREAFPLIPIPFPSTPDYALQARVLRRGNVVHLRQLHGRVGRSDLEGELTLDLAHQPVAVTGRLGSKILFLEDMKGFLGLPVRGPLPRPGKLFPDNPINVRRFHRIDLTLDYHAQSIAKTRAPFEAWQGRIRIEQGVLAVDPLRIRLAGGEANGSLVLDLRETPGTASLLLRFHEVSLGRLLKKLPMLDASRGRVAGEMRLFGRGGSLADIFAASHGRMHLIMIGGRIERAFIDVAGGDLARLLAEEKGAPVPVRCAVSVFDVQSGLARIEAFAVDTKIALITGRGNIDLRREQFALAFVASAKEPGFFTAPSPVGVHGSFSKPEVSLDTSELQGRGITALVLGALMGPLAALAPLVQPGTDEELACGDLVRRFKPKTR